MIYIKSPDCIAQNAELVDDFFDLYEHPQNFPDPNEREPRENILERINTGSTEPKTFLIILNDYKKTNAGVIAEYYPKSSCLLLTYIFVDPKFRKSGLARKLIDNGVPQLIKEIEKHHDTKVRAVFFETNNPFKT